MTESELTKLIERIVTESDDDFVTGIARSSKSEMIDDVITDAEDESSLESSNNIINKFKDKLKKYRTRGLEDGGEYSPENLVFKTLRRNGYIQKLFDFQTNYTDKTLSLKERYLFKK